MQGSKHDLGLFKQPGEGVRRKGTPSVETVGRAACPAQPDAQGPLATRGEGRGCQIGREGWRRADVQKMGQAEQRGPGHRLVAVGARRERQPPGVQVRSPDGQYLGLLHKPQQCLRQHEMNRSPFQCQRYIAQELEQIAQPLFTAQEHTLHARLTGPDRQVGAGERCEEGAARFEMPPACREIPFRQFDRAEIEPRPLSVRRVGRLCHDAQEKRAGGVPFPQIVQERGLVEGDLHIVRPQTCRGIQTFPRFGKPAERHLRQSKIAQGLGPRSAQRDGGLKGVERLVQPSQREQHHAMVGVGGRVPWPERADVPEQGFRLKGRADLPQKGGFMLTGRHIVRGRQLPSLPQRAQGVVDPPLSLQEAAHYHPIARLQRTQADRLAQFRLRFCRVAQRFQRLGKSEAGRGERRVLKRGHMQGGAGGFAMTKGEKGQAQRDMESGIWCQCHCFPGIAGGEIEPAERMSGTGQGVQKKRVVGSRCPQRDKRSVGFRRRSFFELLHRGMQRCPIIPGCHGMPPAAGKFIRSGFLFAKPLRFMATNGSARSGSMPASAPRIPLSRLFPPRWSRLHWPCWHVAVLILLPVLVHLPELLGPLWKGGPTSDPKTVLSVATGVRRNWLEGGLLPGLPGWIDGSAGVMVQALGRLVVRDWVHGVVPWWNPYNGVGMPLAGEYQPGAFFLPFVLLLGLPGGLILLKISLQMLAGMAMYAFLDALELQPLVRLTGGVLWAFNGTFAWASDGPSQPLAFLPLALLGVEKLRNATGRSGWTWLALGLGGLVLTSFPETAFLEGLLVLCWAVLRFWQTVSGQRRAFALRVVAAGITALLLAAPQLVAFVTYLPWAWVGDHVGMMNTSHPGPSWIMSLFPYINGLSFYGEGEQYAAWWAMGGYWGLALPWMALVGLLPALWHPVQERAARLLLAAFFLVCVGKQANLPGVTWLVNLLPGVGHTMFYRLCYPCEEMALILLALFALNDLACTARIRTVSVRTAFAATALLGIGVALAWHLNAGTRHALAHYAHGAVSSAGYQKLSLTFGMATLALCAVGLLASRLRPRLRLFCAAGALGGEALVLFCVPLLCLRSVLLPDQTLLATMQQTLGFNRFVSLGSLTPNYGAYYGLASINQNGVPLPKAWVERLRHDFGPNVDPKSFDGITPITPEGRFFLAPTLATDPGLFERLGVALAVVPHGADIFVPARGRMELIYSNDTNDLYRLPHPAPYFETRPACAMQVIDREHVHLQCSEPAVLVRRELMMPGWHVRLNGASLVPRSEESLFQQMNVPAGVSAVSFYFTPPGMMWGWIGCVMGLICLAGSAGWPRKAPTSV